MLVDSASDLIFSIDSRFIDTSLSPSAEKDLGFKPKELIGRTVTDLEVWSAEYAAKIISELTLVLSGQTIASSSYELYTKDGIRQF